MGILVLSSLIISSSLCLLGYISTRSSLSRSDDFFCGTGVTSAIIAGSWGIASGKSDPIEASLLVSSIIFADFNCDI